MAQVPNKYVTVFNLTSFLKVFNNCNSLCYDLYSLSSKFSAFYTPFLYVPFVSICYLRLKCYLSFVLLYNDCISYAFIYEFYIVEVY